MFGSLLLLSLNLIQDNSFINYKLGDILVLDKRLIVFKKIPKAGRVDRSYLFMFQYDFLAPSIIIWPRQISFSYDVIVRYNYT